MSKVFLIFFPLFFFFSLLETPIAFRVRVLAAKPPRPPHPPTDRPRLLRGAVSPPHQNPPIWGNSSLPLSPGAPGFARDALRGGWRASAGRENRGIGAAPHPAPPSHFFSNFVFIFFFFPLPESVFRPPAPAGRAGGPGSPVPAPVREPGGPGAGPGAERLGWGVRRGGGQTYRGYLFSHFSFIS